jgi:simple sugar transport system permease protein
MLSLVRKNIPQTFISLFLIAMLAAIFTLSDISLSGLAGDALTRLFMNGVLVLALLPMLNVGMGINYGLPIGILAGLLGMSIAFNYKLNGILGLGGAIGLSILIGIVFGYGYAWILNRTRGKEEISGLFTGFSAVFIMNFFWAVAPFHNPEMVWPIGGAGLRPSIGLNNHFAKVLNDWGAFNLAGVHVPTAGLLLFSLLCLAVYFFFKTKSGWAVLAAGENESYSRFAGVNIYRIRTLAVIISTVLAAVGICVYAQSFGFIELYESPLNMVFPAAAAVLLGGSLGGRSTVRQVIIGTFLFQTIYILSGPLANSLLTPQLTEISRVIISNGIILYAILYEGGRRKA